jgi:uncharacterized protein
VNKLELDMNISRLLLQLLAESDGHIESKTKIQKEMYFLSKRLRADFGFRPHYYGPYSPEVDKSLDELSGAGFIQVHANSLGVDFNRGFEILRYDFLLTESGKGLLQEIGDSQEKIEVHSFIADLKRIGDPDYLDLSIAAKVLFIKDTNKATLSEKEIKNTAQKFGWNLNNNDIDKAPKILTALGFS